MESTGSLRKLHRKNQGHRNCGGLFKNKIPVCRVVCAPLFPSPEQTTNGKAGFGGFRTAICTGEVFRIKCRFVRLFRQPVDFLVWLRRLWIALQTNSRPALKQCLQSNRSARQACENPPKVCRNKRTNLHFDFGR